MKTNPDLLEPDLGYRINAIRETFEETGILLHLSVEGRIKSEQVCQKSHF
jgi:8-oxo-dGTP pyrophosphatase MutT (NUDIX family)